MPIDIGNTFSELGVPQPELAKIKSDMALAVYRAIQSCGLSQSEAAAIRSVINNCAYRLVLNLVSLQGSTKSFASIYDALYSMGVDQAKVSAISRGITKGYTVDRLMTFLNRLDMDVDIRLKPKPKRNKIAHTRVTGIAG